MIAERPVTVTMYQPRCDRCDWYGIESQFKAKAKRLWIKHNTRCKRAHEIGLRPILEKPSHINGETRPVCVWRRVSDGAKLITHLDTSQYIKVRMTYEEALEDSYVRQGREQYTPEMFEKEKPTKTIINVYDMLCIVLETHLIEQYYLPTGWDWLTDDLPWRNACESS